MTGYFSEVRQMAIYDGKWVSSRTDVHLPTKAHAYRQTPNSWHVQSFRHASILEVEPIAEKSGV